MVVFCIRARCLAQEFEWKKNYENLNDLKHDIYKQFQLFSINDQCGIIVYFDETDKCDRILDNLDILPKDGSTVFNVYVKKVHARRLFSLDKLRIIRNLDLGLLCNLFQSIRYHTCTSAT